MTLNVGKEVAALSRMTVRELRERYAELFAETTQARNRTWLIRRIIWRMQSLAGGGLSEQARQRAEELANTSDLRVTAPRAEAVPRCGRTDNDRRVPRKSQFAASTPRHAAHARVQRPSGPGESRR